VDRRDGVPRFADYRGMDAAVTETANEALGGIGEDARAELPALVTGLVADVAADPITGVPIPVVAALDRGAFVAGRPAREVLLEAFVAKRLLTAEGDGVSQRVRPTHEALLRIWPQAARVACDAQDTPNWGAGPRLPCRTAISSSRREWSPKRGRC
jgi:hypothetical protein